MPRCSPKTPALRVLDSVQSTPVYAFRILQSLSSFVSSHSQFSLYNNPHPTQVSTMLCAYTLVIIAWMATLLNDGAVDAAVWSVPVKHLHQTQTTTCDVASYLRTNPLVAWTSRSFGLDSTGKHAEAWTPSFPKAKAHSTEDVDFRSFEPGHYAAQIMFGTPPQPVSLLLTLQYTDFLTLNHKQGSHMFYDHAKSSTYRANGTWVIINEHSPDEEQGFVSRDTVTIPGAGDHLHIQDFSFVELDRVKNFPPHLDGFIGLGPCTQDATGTPSIVQAMISQGLLDQPIVGAQLTSEKAHLTFGGLDAKHSDSDITYFSNGKGGWWLPLGCIVVNGEVVVAHGGDAYIAEWLPVIAGPADQVNALAQVVGAKNRVILCDRPGPDITIVLGEFVVKLTKADYTINVRQGVCSFAFFPLNATTWLLGQPFVNRVYMVLDYGSGENDARLGLAHLKP